jgi:hypothetical protein
LSRLDDGIDRNLLGMDFLKNYSLLFRFDKGKITTNFRGNSDFELRDLFLDKGGIPYVDVDFGNSTAKSVWDTGAGVTLVDINFIHNHPTMFEKIGMSTGTDSIGTSSETPTLKMKSVKIGGMQFSPHMVVGLDLSHVNSKIDHPFDFLLGYSTLKQAHWHFDFPAKKWGLIPSVK